MCAHPGVPLDPAVLHPHHWVADIVYRPARTELIDTAAALGCAVMPGQAMAVGQAADTFQLVTGLQPDRARMQQHNLGDRKSTRLNSSHVSISYAVFCLQ